mmetsp:Transcript_27264/g.74625  ORF Transcript_27264/g.74625 Transcript_27264/m.74625 type:complete len:206 (+) Transcript_27264:4477-5094(+)
MPLHFGTIPHFPLVLLRLKRGKHPALGLTLVEMNLHQLLHIPLHLRRKFRHPYAHLLQLFLLHILRPRQSPQLHILLRVWVRHLSEPMIHLVLLWNLSDWLELTQHSSLPPPLALYIAPIVLSKFPTALWINARSPFSPWSKCALGSCSLVFGNTSPDRVSKPGSSCILTMLNVVGMESLSSKPTLIECFSFSDDYNLRKLTHRK